VIRAIFFDAGNTLLSMNYPVIAAELARHGVAVTPEAVRRAEWRARVRLDAEVFAPSRPDVSTESGSSAGRYVRHLLAELEIRDEAVVRAVVEWRRGYNLPVGLWNLPDPHAERALRGGAATISPSGSGTSPTRTRSGRSGSRGTAGSAPRSSRTPTARCARSSNRSGSRGTSNS